jgi:hypothetical protein
MKLRLTLLYILLLFNICQLTLASHGEPHIYGDFNTGEGPADLSSDSLGDLTNEDITRNPTLLNQIAANGELGKLNKDVLAKNINKIDSKYANKLTADQLLYTGSGELSFDKLSKEQKGNLDKNALNEVLDKLGRTTENIRADTNNAPTEIESTPNGFFIPDAIYEFSLGDVSVSQGKGIRYENNVLTIQEADTIQIKDGLIVQAKNFTGTSIEFFVGRAQTIIIDGKTISDISNSTFEITNEGMRIDSHSDSSFAITDSFYVQSVFRGNGTLIIETPTHAKDDEVSFAAREIAEWIRETIAAIPQDAMVTVDRVPIPAKDAAEKGYALFYDTVSETISTTQTPNSIALAFDWAMGNFQFLPTAPFSELLWADLLVDELIDINTAEQSLEESSVYTVTDGTLTVEGENGILGLTDTYNESIDAFNSTAVIIVDPAFGVSCMQLLPKSTYHYIDPIIEKDFSLSIPANGAPYALCLKKSAGQELFGYEGVVDFTTKEIDLRNVINYKRYPLKNNKIADTLTTEVFEGKSNSRAELRYLPTFILLDSIMLYDVGTQSTPLTSRTKPSNYYSITQENIDGESKRLVLVNWKLKGNQYTQSIPQSYIADDSLPKLTLVHNVLIQDNSITRATILPPDHGQIATLIE